MSASILPSQIVEARILFIRGEKVIIDSDMAEIYGVPTKRLNEQVKRNRFRFPSDFMLQLTAEEKSEVVAKCDHLKKLKFSAVLPHAFTEHGAVMLASILSTPLAVEASIQVVRAFVRIRTILSAHKELARKIEDLERKYLRHEKRITEYHEVFEALKKLIAAPEPIKKKIGFQTK